jgi:hypothetical protein
MAIDEIEIYVTRDGLGRAAIVRRTDGLFCIYYHGRGSGSWLEDDNPAFLRYEDPNPEELAEPAIGIYGTLDDARNQIRAARRFADAVLKYPKGRLRLTCTLSPSSVLQKLLLLP